MLYATFPDFARRLQVLRRPLCHMLISDRTTCAQFNDSQVDVGEEVKVVGNLEELGSWDASEGLALQLVQDRADIDISGPEFNFVRSIRVYDVRFARQHESGRDGDCNRSAVIYLGTYGIQGEFSWARSGPTILPPAHTGLERWGSTCPSI